MDITNSNVAFMIRNDGVIFPVKVHPYGNEDVEFIEETLASSEWLYYHTQHDTTKKLVCKLIKTWILNSNYDPYKSLLYNIQREIKNRPYKYLTTEFIESVISEIENEEPIDSLETLNKLVCLELNQEFLRARYGGMYNTNPASREMVFRVSSAEFNWFDIIWKFVNDNKLVIDYVTICSDEESTGKESYYYNYKDHIFYKIKTDEFIVLSGNPVIESTNRLSDVKYLLSKGHSLLESDRNKNYERIVFNHTLRREKEIDRCFSQTMDD